MIDAHQVDQLEQMAEAFDPPLIARGGHGIPLVQRVAPQLTGGAEIVRWYAGRNERKPALVELEQVLVRPHVGAVVRAEDGDVADDGDTPPAGRASMGQP